MANDQLLSIAPFYIPEAGQLSFPTAKLNTFARARYNDVFGFYQQNFNLYGFMQLNRLFEYEVHTPKGNPLGWQVLNSCSYDDTGTITVGRRSIKPDKVYWKEKTCWDELFDSCYEHMINFASSGDIELTPDGVQQFNILVDELVANMALGARLLLTAGDLYDVNTIAFSDDNTANITDLFKRTHGSTYGWVKLFVDMAASGEAPQLNKALLDPANDFDEYGYTGSVVDFYDNLVKGAPRKLRQLVNTGGTISAGRNRFFPLLLLSHSMHQRLVAEWKIQSELVAQNNPRITKRSFGGVESPTPQVVYFIDETPVIPLEDISGYDQYTKVDTHVGALVASGNIQMGLNFDNLPLDVENSPVGLMIEQQRSITQPDYGSYHFLSHGLMKVALADAEYAAAAITSTTE